jgi:hypothetical protein
MASGLCPGESRVRRTHREPAGFSPEAQRILAITPARDIPNHHDPHSQSERTAVLAAFPKPVPASVSSNGLEWPRISVCRSSLGAEPRGKKLIRHQLRDQSSAELKQEGSGTISLSRAYRITNSASPYRGAARRRAMCSGPPHPLQGRRRQAFAAVPMSLSRTSPTLRQESFAGGSPPPVGT